MLTVYGWMVSSLHATIIVSIRTHEGITVGADSRAVYRDLSSVDTACKINTHRDMVAAWSGRSAPGRGFDLSVITQQILEKGDLPLIERVDEFRRIALVKVGILVREAKTTEPERYRDWVSGDRVFCEVLFAGFENAKPVMYMAQIKVNPDATVNPALLRSVDTFQATEREVWPQGESMAVNEFLRRNPKAWVSTPTLPLVKLLMQIAQQAKPQTVGGPFAIVTVGADGVSWIQRGSCK